VLLALAARTFRLLMTRNSLNPTQATLSPHSLQIGESALEIAHKTSKLNSSSKHISLRHCPP